MLELKAIDTYRGPAHILYGVSLHVEKQEVVCLVGRNGAGKTTTLRTIMGFVPATRGAVLFGETRLDRLKPHQRPGLGIGYAPEDRRLFAGFSVEDNLLLPLQVAGRTAADGRRRLAEIYEILPELAELRSRPAGSVSGGQGKMVALGRALMIGHRLVLLDEPFQGLAPVLANRYVEALRRLTSLDPAPTLLITESNPTLLATLAATMLTIERGEIADQGREAS